MVQDNANEYDYDWSDDYENLDATGTLTQVGCAVVHGLAGGCAAVQSSHVQPRLAGGGGPSSSHVQLCGMAAAQFPVAALWLQSNASIAVHPSCSSKAMTVEQRLL